MPYSSNWKLAGALNLRPVSELESPKTTICTEVPAQTNNSIVTPPRSASHPI